MNVSELLLGIKDISFDSLVQQSNIQTDEDKHKYLDNGYFSVLTEKEFREKFDIDPACVWYMPSLSQPCIYFNKDSLAVSFFPIEYFSTGIMNNVDVFYQVINERESEIKDGNYQSSISCLPDAMRLEYFNMLIERYGGEIPNLYNLFFSNYIRSDYGFKNINPNTLSVILSSKTDSDKEKTSLELTELPETLTVYRGGNSASTSYDKAYSWTLDMNVANFFASRHGNKDGYIVSGEIQKKDIIETFLTEKGEKEIFIKPSDVRILSKSNIQGMNFIEATLPEISSMYRKYRDQMESLTFAQKSSVHGYEHQARVLLLALTIANHLKLPSSDRKILATAAIYHDTQRVHDDTDELHGKTSREYYHNNVSNPDPLVEFLCEYHCLPDEDGYKEIFNNRVLSKNRSRSKMLIDIFKDADALERVRFGIKELDMNQLRLPISKELTLVARLYLENIKVNLNVKYASNNLNEKISAAEKTVSKRINKSFSNEKER